MRRGDYPLGELAQVLSEDDAQRLIRTPLNVAKVFLNWLMSKECQAILVDQGGLAGSATTRGNFR
jgi:hypothetical protein